MIPLVPKPERIWIRSDHVIISTGRNMWKHLASLQERLRTGVFATPDAKRPGFFELEFDNRWYYLHFPERIGGIYLIAAGDVRFPSVQASRAVMCA